MVRLRSPSCRFQGVKPPKGSVILLNVYLGPRPDPLSVFEVGHRLPEKTADRYTVLHAHGILWDLRTSMRASGDFLCYDNKCDFVLKFSRSTFRVLECRPHTCERALHLRRQVGNSQKVMDGIKRFTSGSDQWWT